MFVVFWRMWLATTEKVSFHLFETNILQAQNLDRIWMRRTKKVKRNFHICIAVDDSASMKDNLMTEVMETMILLWHTNEIALQNTK